MRSLFLRAAIVCALLVVPTVARAQQTGSVSGAVYDRNGNPIAAATVRISGDPMPSARTSVTSDRGTYIFMTLLPGTYTLEVEKTGVGKMSRPVVVEVARDTQNDFILGLPVAEELTITAKTPDVDMKSSEVNFNYKREFIQNLPLERSYLGLTQLIPGIADNGGFAPNGGGSRQDNVYLLDSVNITNPLFGYLSTEINELDIAEVNAKRGAITAEFGRSIGFVTNAITKSGTNHFAGNYRFEAIPDAFITTSFKMLRNASDRWVNAFDVGGPIQKSRLFFYASGRIFRSRTRTFNYFGRVPDRDEHSNEGFGKITAQIGAKHFVNAGYRHKPNRVVNASLGANDSPAVATNSHGTNKIATVNVHSVLGNRTTLSVDYVHLNEGGQSDAVTDLGFQRLPFNANNPTEMGRVVIDGIAYGAASLKFERFVYHRDEVKATLAHFFDARKTSHQVKVGFDWDRGTEDLTRRANGWGTVSSGFVNTVRYIQAQYEPDQPPQFSVGRTYSLFVQDDLSLSPRLTFNAGLLLTRDEFAQRLATTKTFLAFGFADEIQPRLGVNYQLRPGHRDKVYATWGRYYGLDQKSSARALAPAPLYTETALFTTSENSPFAVLVSKTPDANTTGKTIAPDLKAPYTDEVVVGYAAPLPDGWALDAFFLYRDSDSFIEDRPAVLPFSNFEYHNDPSADRQYKTFTIELKRPIRNRWAMNLSYAWSRLEGTFDQDYAGGLEGTPVFNTSSLINDGPGTFTEDRFRRGPLSQDRPHVFKILATWLPPWIDNSSVGLYVRGQSGTPWEARGLPWSSTVIYLRDLEPAGASRNPFWTNVDLDLKYGIKVDPRRIVRVEARILNLFNQEVALTVDQRRFLDPRSRTLTTTPLQSCLSCWTDAMVQLTNAPNPRFGFATNYSQPRRLLVSLLFDF